VIAIHRAPRVRCETDDWTFDPRYTQGRCPICGWAPEHAPSAPRWLALVNRLDWEMAGLLFLADVLVLLGLIVAHAAGLVPTHAAGPSLPSAVGVASGARSP
jgi:hypothetical protein